MTLRCKTSLFMWTVLLVFARSVSLFKITRLEVPSQVRIGSTARLVCEYELAPYRKLYTLRWLKNNVEFYRYDPNVEDRHNFYRIHGLHVNTDKSNSTLMYIDHASREDTEGLYTCEVTTFPSFARTSESKRLTVVARAADALQLKNDGDKDSSRKNTASFSSPCCFSFPVLLLAHALVSYTNLMNA